jgi:hypothetical protein
VGAGKLRGHIVEKRLHLEARRVGAAGLIRLFSGSTVSPGTAHSSAGISFGSCVLKMRAPCDPPKMSRWGGAIGAVGGVGNEKKSGRTGTPVTSALRNHAAAAGKLTAAAFTRLPTKRLARPGMALGSKAMAGTLSQSAAAIAGPEA